MAPSPAAFLPKLAGAVLDSESNVAFVEDHGLK
jgi:hypothetical protein